MDILEHFYNNKCLFKCDQNCFDHEIKRTLETLLLNNQIISKNVVHLFDNVKITKCIICLQSVIDNGDYVICDNCCNTCINKKIKISIFGLQHGIFRVITRYICFNIGGCYGWHYSRCCNLIKYFPNIEQNHNNSKCNIQHIVSKLFINNSYKLIRRFFNTVSIIFLMSSNDVHSLCHMLNPDVIMYILKFIY